MSRFIDRTGLVYGSLTVKKVDGVYRQGSTWWICKCKCGTTIKVRGSGLTAGSNQSCGCMKGGLISKANTTHGMRYHPAYSCWRQMLRRCDNKKAADYKYYGAKGVTVCKAWHDVGIFIQWAVAHGWNPGLTIDRIRSRGNYTPSNCRFITQSENSKRNAGKKRSTNTSGHCNIFRSKNGKRWVAITGHTGISRRVGTYDTLKEAIAARDAATG